MKKRKLLVITAGLLASIGLFSTSAYADPVATSRLENKVGQHMPELHADLTWCGSTASREGVDYKVDYCETPCPFNGAVGQTYPEEKLINLYGRMPQDRLNFVFYHEVGHTQDVAWESGTPLRGVNSGSKFFKDALKEEVSQLEYLTAKSGLLLSPDEAFADAYALYIVEKPALQKYAPGLFSIMQEIDGEQTTSSTYIWKQVGGKWFYTGDASNINTSEFMRVYESNDIQYHLAEDNSVIEIVPIGVYKVENYVLEQNRLN